MGHESLGSSTRPWSGGERRLAVLALLLTASFHLFPVADRRLPRGHATLEYYRLQQTFHDGGKLGIREQAAQSSLLQTIIFDGPLPWPRWTFHLVFQLGLLSEELLLLLGCWLLGRRWFRSPVSVFFVSIAAVGSSLWADNVWLNVHAVYALPLVVELLHRAFESGSRGLFLLAGSLSAAQMLGNLPETALVTPIAALSYVPARAFVLGRAEPRSGSRSAAIALLPFLPVLGLYLLSAGAASAPAEGFGAALLVRTTWVNPLQYADLAIGIAPHLDCTVYAGACTAAFGLVALLSLPPKTSARLAAAVLVSTAVLGFFCAVVPSLRSARPLPVAAPLVRLAVIFVAGFGLDRFLEDPTRERPRVRQAGVAMIAVAALLEVLSLGVDWNNLPLAESLLRRMVSGVPEEAVSPTAYSSTLLPDLLSASAASAALAGGTLLLAAAGPRTLPLAVALLLVLHPLDVFGWKFRQTWTRTAPSIVFPEAKPQVPYGAPVLLRTPTDRATAESLSTWAHLAFGAALLNAILLVTGLMLHFARPRSRPESGGTT